MQITKSPFQIEDYLTLHPALHTKERCENTDELDEVGYMLREIQQWLRDGEAPE